MWANDPGMPDPARGPYPLEPILTQRLLLRPLRDDDCPAIAACCNDMRIASNTLLIPHPYTIDDARAFLAIARQGYASGGTLPLAITLRNEPAAPLVGCIGLSVETLHNRAELGYWIGFPHWGKGYATEAGHALLRFAFENLALRRVQAGHYTTNPASKRVLEKLGMQFEGVQRAHVVRFGRTLDLGLYAILAEEWRAMESTR